MCKHSGLYQHQETLLYPFSTKRYPEPCTKKIGVDACLVDFILTLWEQGIETIESCCGHGTNKGYVIVEEKHIEKMHKLGFSLYDENKLNNCFELMDLEDLKLSIDIEKLTDRTSITQQVYEIMEKRKKELNNANH